MRIPGAAAEMHNMATGGAGPSPRLVGAAHEFEAQMMKELLKPLEQDSLAPDASDRDESSSEVLGDFAMEALGSSLSQHGGLGIADRILQDLSANGLEDGQARVEWDKRGSRSL